MSDKRKDFRHIFMVKFLGPLLIVLTIGGALVIDEISPDKKNAGANVPQQENQMISVIDNDSVPAIKKYIFIVGDEYHPEEIHDSLFSFEINYDSTKNGIGEWDNFIKSVGIILLLDHKKIQTITSPESYTFESYSIPITVEDMNFDGYNDFRVLDFVMMYGQSFYHFWLYNPKKGLFEPNTSLTRTVSPRFDPETKKIYSSCRGAGPFDIINQTYTWGNKTLVLQEEDELFTILDSVPYAITMTKRINGKLVIRSKNFADPPITNSGQVIFDWDKLK